jgi:phage terminase large subunit-like protein
MVIEEFAAFPTGDHDDLVDSSTQALLRFRQGGFIRIESDEEEEEFLLNRKADYY